MALYQTKFYRGDTEFHSRDCRGSCTGAFQGGGYGYFPNGVLNGADTMTVETSCVTELSDIFMRKVAETPLLQALVPGFEFVHSAPVLGDNGHKRITWRFPGIDVLPSDQVICAMRIVNSWGGGYFQRQMKTLREHELTASEMLVVAMFGCNHPRSSDSQPSLHYNTKAFTRTPEWINTGRSLQINVFEIAKKQPHAGMLLPLIRGEINRGVQPLIATGYMKEGAILQYLTGDPYGARLWWDSCPDDGFVTVNHPLIHPSEEGPVLDFTDRNLTQVADWVLQQLGK